MKLFNLHIFKWFKRTTSIKKLSVHERGWLEGIINGEGSLMLVKQTIDTPRGYYFRPCLLISSTTKKIIDRVFEITQQGSICRREDKKRPNLRPFYVYTLTGVALRSLLEQIQLIAKEEHRLLLIEAIDLLPCIGTKQKEENESYKRLDEIRKKILELNKRGRQK